MLVAHRDGALPQGGLLLTLNTYFGETPAANSQESTAVFSNFRDFLAVFDKSVKEVEAALVAESVSAPPPVPRLSPAAPVDDLATAAVASCAGC